MTGEMLQLLLLAAALWCLFEYRRASGFRWLQAAALIWGLGIAENWMMMLALPAFVALVLWFGRFRILAPKPILQLALAGLAGFSVFLLMPVVNGISPGSPWDFGEALHRTLAGFYGILKLVYYNFWRAHKMVFIAVSIFYLLPTLMLVVRLRDVGTQSAIGVDRFQAWLYRALQTSVLLACLWLLFNPVVGPQPIVFKQIGLNLPFLSLDYLLAIGIAFLAGNLMLALLASRRRDDYNSNGGMETLFRRVTVPAFSGLLLLVGAGLILKNASAITLPNRLPLEQFGRLALQGLPADRFVLLSDDPQRLYAFQAGAAGSGRNFLALDMRLLSVPSYRRWLAARHPDPSLAVLPTNNLTATENLMLVSQLGRTNPVYYLHPSFGQFFELIYSEPIGIVSDLKLYQDKAVNPPPMSAATLARNEALWSNCLPQLEAVSKTISEATPHRRSLTGKIYQRFHLQPAPVVQSQLLGEWYSMTLDDWGVRLQRAGQLEKAKQQFELAAALNPNNPAVKVNLLSNSNLLAGATLNLTGVETIASQLGQLSKMSKFIFLYGTMDEPAFCYVLGSLMVKANLPRQALQQLERARELAPDVLLPKMALAELYAQFGFAEKARDLLQQVRKETAQLPKKEELETSLSLIEANSWLAQTNTANAREVLQNLLANNPDDPRTQNTVAQAYYSLGDYSNALEVINRQLDAKPDDLAVMVNQATLQLKMGNSTQAIATLDHVISQTNTPQLRLIRNVARIEAGQLQAAEADYLEMQKTEINQTPIWFGLAEIAMRRNDTNRAVELLERCTELLPADSPQYRVLTNRISQMKQPQNISTGDTTQTPIK